MANNESSRNVLRGGEDRIFDLVSSTVAVPQEWEEVLRVPLEHAAAQGNVVLADKLVKAGAGFGFAVHDATEGGQVEIVNNLLESGASLGGKDSRGYTLSMLPPELENWRWCSCSS